MPEGRVRVLPAEQEVRALSALEFLGAAGPTEKKPHTHPFSKHVGFPLFLLGPLSRKPCVWHLWSGHNDVTTLFLMYSVHLGVERSKSIKKAEGSQEGGMPRSALRKEQARLTEQGGGDPPQRSQPYGWAHDGNNCFYLWTVDNVPGLC